VLTCVHGCVTRQVEHQSGASAKLSARVGPPQDPETSGPQGEPQSQEVPLETATDSVPITGYLKTRYWARWTNSESDHDLYQTLYFDIGDPATDSVTFHFMGRASADLDGRDNPSLFSNITDTFESRVNGRLYDAYADFANALSLGAARVGRQQIYETPVVAYFDGLLLESEPFWDSEVQMGLYGGIPVALFESSSEGDSIWGAYTQARPWAGGRVRLDYMDMDERYLSSNPRDKLLGLGAWQSIGDHWTVDGQYTMQNWNSRDFRLGGRYYDLQSDFSAQASYYNLLKPQRRQVLELDPFFNSLFEYFPFQQFGVLATKGIGDHVNLQGGIDIRRVTDGSDIGSNNRDYERYFLTAGIREVGWKGFGFSLTGDIWDSGERDINTFALGLDQELAGGWGLSAGTYFSLYRFDVLTGQERDNVRTYYLKARYLPSKDWVFDLNFSYEDTDIVDFYGLILGVTWRF
jgi:hypothetical protein